MISGGLTKITPPTEGPRGWELKPATSGLTGTIVLGALALFWNGGVLYALIQTWRAENWLMASGVTLFLLLFAAFGALLLWGFVHQLLKMLFTPQVTLTLSDARLTLGQATDLSWTILDQRRRVTSFDIHLVLREESHYRRGTDSVTDRHEAYRCLLHRSLEPTAHGRCVIRFPSDVPPSFTGKSNQLVWSLEISGAVTGLPDIDETYPLAVAATVDTPAALVPLPLPDDAQVPEGSPSLTLANQGLDVPPGQPVAGIVHAPDQPVTLRLLWKTSGKGDQEEGVAACCTLAPNTAGFLLTLPSHPPLWYGTVSGTLRRTSMVVPTPRWP